MHTSDLKEYITSLTSELLACGITNLGVFSFVLQLSPKPYLILCWMFSSPELQFTPGWFSTEKCNQKTTKHHLFETSAHWGCVAGAKLQLSAYSSRGHKRSQVAFGTGLQIPLCGLCNTWHPVLGSSWLLTPTITLVPPKAGNFRKKLLYLCPLIASHSLMTVLRSWHS